MREFHVLSPRRASRLPSSSLVHVHLPMLTSATWRHTSPLKEGLYDVGLVRWGPFVVLPQTAFVAYHSLCHLSRLVHLLAHFSFLPDVNKYLVGIRNFTVE